MAKMQRQTRLTDYEGFVEKFKPKKTTDDCYTPQPVYDALVGWCREKITAVRDATEIVRPFWPGGDYETYDYPDGCVVIDNPPFSILAKICDSYIRNGIRFVLFAPHLTLFGALRRPQITAIVADCVITYENGAKVNTSFLTNCWDSDDAAVIEGGLKKCIEAANKNSREPKKTKVVNWPENVTSSALLGKCIAADLSLAIPRSESAFIGKLDNGQQIFGGGYWSATI